MITNVPTKLVDGACFPATPGRRAPSAPGTDRPRSEARSPSPSRMLSPVGVADALDVSVKTVRRWIDARELRAHKLGRQLRISVEDLDAFVKQRRD